VNFLFSEGRVTRIEEKKGHVRRSERVYNKGAARRKKKCANSREDPRTLRRNDESGPIHKMSRLKTSGAGRWKGSKVAGGNQGTRDDR